MALLVLQFLIYLIAWASGVTGFVITNSFDNWVGNTTYRITWDTSSSDPSVYDYLELVQPRDDYPRGIAPDVSWPDRWSYKYAVQIPQSGDHSTQVILGSDVWPGPYYWRMAGGGLITAVSDLFLISSSNGRTTPATITSLVPVTATQDVIQTSDGRVVTYHPSEVYSSVTIYTTIIVVSDGGKGASLAKIPMIIGISLALIFLITLPIILWLVLRYRRRSNQSSGGDKPTQIDLEDVHNSSVLDLMPSNAPAAGSTAIPAASTRQVWAIVDGDKRLVTISQDSPQPMTPTVDSDPFTDPFTPKSPRRILIPANPSTPEHDSPSNSINPFDPLLSRANTATTSFSAVYSRGAPRVDAHTDPTQSDDGLTEKMPQQARERFYSDHSSYTLR
ncbi:hypothetical protein RSAG8_08267, partial [Rhizoctonia solani AG-8 WAC10335]